MDKQEIDFKSKIRLTCTVVTQKLACQDGTCKFNCKRLFFKTSKYVNMIQRVQAS